MSTTSSRRGGPLKWLALCVLLLTALSGFGYLAFQLGQGGKPLGRLSGPAKKFVKFPSLVGAVLSGDELRGIPRTYLPLDDGTAEQNEEINRLDYDLFATLSFYNVSTGRWDIELRNLRNDNVLHTWYYGPELHIGGEGLSFAEAQVKHPLPLADGSLLLYSRESANLLKLDAGSKLLWRNQDFIYHHSINLDAEGNIWACGSRPSERMRDLLPLNYNFVNSDGAVRSVRDDRLVQLNGTTGRTLRDRSVTELLIEKGYAGLVFGVAGDEDPIHLNDIEPVLESGSHWSVGELFVSVRNRSLLLHYDPVRDSIHRLIQGPFVHQHDVDIPSDSTLSLFNNNFGRIGTGGDPEAEPDHELRASNIMTYDYGEQTFDVLFPELMIRENLYTPTGGVHRLLENGDLFLDLDDFGRVMVLRDDEIILRKIFPAPREGYKHITNWTRVYLTNPIKETL